MRIRSSRRWTVTSIPYEPAYARDLERLEAAGWEPFAILPADRSGAAPTIHLRIRMHPRG